MSPDEARERLALYALGALEPDERRALEAVLARHPALAEELASLERAAAELPLALLPLPPPEGLEARVMGSLPRREPARGASPARPAVRVWPRLLSAAATVALLVSATWGGLAGWGWVRALGDPSSTVITLVDGRGAVVGRALVRRDRQVLLALRLPPPGPGRVFQAWGVGAGQPLPLATFRWSVLTLRLPPQAAALAVSQEPAGGSPAPTVVLGLPR